MGAALRGLKVIECATVIAAPLCGRLMADFGAEVIHIEHPKTGDHLRQFGFTVDGVNPWWKYYARNKKLVTLDISKPKGRDLLVRMLADADIFVENFRPGRLEEWGIHYKDLAEINPRLIMVRVTGYGQTGPYSSQPGFGTIIESMSGFAAMTGEEDGPPIIPQFALADSFAGMYAALAAMFAVYHRDVLGHGRGQVIDVSILESLFGMLGPNRLVYEMSGKAPRRLGNRTETTAPRNVYHSLGKEGYAIYMSYDLAQTVPGVIAYVQDHDDELIDLRVERPSLEERFLELTSSTSKEDF
jgi:crotonobetainyl-CoA:carnitine CoA-transferase CaiB-like acyl-CoA transferase